MTIDIRPLHVAPETQGRGVTRSDIGTLRAIAIAAGLISGALFIIVGLGYGLQTYGDGSIFSYAVTVQDSWAFHFHNISGRAFVWLYAMLPAEAFVALTKDARGGIVLYGLLFFSAQLLGLVATWFADRSRGRIIFATACGSTALLCPMVFGAPTETWASHALFWPTLAFCHYARASRTATLTIFVALLALIFTHAGAIMLAFAIVATLWLRGPQDPAFRRTAIALFAALAIWVIVKFALPPDDYIAAVLADAVLHAFDPSHLTGDLFDTIAVTLVGFTVLLTFLRRLKIGRAHIYAALAAATVLATHWLWFDSGLHTYHRYFLRTVVLVATPALGVLAMAYTLVADGTLKRNVPLLSQVMAALTKGAVVRAAIGAFALVMLIHAIETAKFVVAWDDYKAAVRTLAMSGASDPALGDPRFVSAARIDARINRAAWNSTTPYLSVLLAPDFAPTRLVVDPGTNYFWISCQTATENLEAQRAVPKDARALIRTYACLHR
ncbi:MAG: hypothetical protein ACXWKA_09585 [Xanthobacteraceae bacterium]